MCMIALIRFSFQFSYANAHELSECRLSLHLKLQSLDISSYNNGCISSTVCLFVDDFERIGFH